MKQAEIQIDEYVAYIKLNDKPEGQKVKTSKYLIKNKGLEGISLLVDKTEDGLILGIEVLDPDRFFSEEILDKCRQK